MLIRVCTSLQKKIFLPEVKRFYVSLLTFLLFKKAIPFLLCISLALVNPGKGSLPPTLESLGWAENSDRGM